MVEPYSWSAGDEVTHERLNQTGITNQSTVFALLGPIEAQVGYEIIDTFTAVATLDFASIAANTSSELTITVEGAKVDSGNPDEVTLGLPSAIETGLAANAYVSAADTVTVRLSNVTVGAINPASAVFRVTVRRYELA